MGIGAGFKFGDKKEGKDRDKDKGEEHDVSRSKLGGTDESLWKEGDGISHETVNPPLGWTSMTEDWLSSGAHFTNSQNKADTTNGNSPSEPSTKHTGDLHEPCDAKDQRGPYQLLTKERMMGIYLALYINHDIFGLVKGTPIPDIVTSCG